MRVYPLTLIALLSFQAMPAYSAGHTSEAVCSGHSQSHSPLNQTDSNSLQFLSRLIIGQYSSEVFRQTCKLTYTTPKGETAQCSGTLIGERKVLTAAHCKAVPGTVTMTCLCGVDPATKEEVFAETKLLPSSETHPTYGKPEAGPIGFDLQVGYLSKAPECPKSFPKIEPISIPSSLASTKALINTGNCHFSGFGYDNDGALGKLHAVSVPKKFVYESNSEDGVKAMYGTTTPTEWITYVSEATIKITAEKLRELKDSLAEKGEISSDKTKDIDAYIANYVLNTRLEIKDDPNGKNAFSPGDSGGSLICTGKDNKRFLVGTLVQGFQSAIVLNDPPIWEWLKQKL